MRRAFGAFSMKNFPFSPSLTSLLEDDTRASVEFLPHPGRFVDESAMHTLRYAPSIRTQEAYRTQQRRIIR